MIDFLISFNSVDMKFEFINRPDHIIEINSKSRNLLLWGDPISHEELIFTDSTTENEVIEKIGGHFYYVFCDKDKNLYSIGNSVFGILPLYYATIGEIYYFSNSPLSIADRTGLNKISKRFILENVLFNYQLFNHSCFEGINLLPVNSCIKPMQYKIRIEKLIRIEDYFVSNPVPWRKSVKNIANVFIDRMKYYLPSENYVSALTGGFDSRTLMASSIYYKKKFKVYSFGNEKSADVNIPQQLALIGSKDYLNVSLDEKYINNKSYTCGLDFIVNSNGTASFSRAHYLYAASQLKSESKYIITGNFGSELFRTAHVAGVVTSKNLYQLFSTSNFEEAIEKVNASDEWEALHRSEFEKEWLELVEDIKTLPCFNEQHKRLTKNAQFYIFIFNEVFRKYFGSEMVNQYKIIINRTPYLDFQFVKEVLKTEIAGVYSDFFTHNPFKRFKGQVIYAHIINLTFPLLGNVMTDKGYKPNSLLNSWGKVQIAIAYTKKKFSKAESNDGNSVSASFNANKERILSEITPNQYFNNRFIKNGIEGIYKNKDSFFIALSQLWWISYLEKKYGNKN